MGVTGLFQYTCERYPASYIEARKKDEFDNLYIDMNEILHDCSSVYDDLIGDYSDDIIEDIFRCLESLFRLVRPQKVLFLSVDGDSPTAKQYRKKAKDPNANIYSSQEERKILPGTVFMKKVDSELKTFLKEKKSDALWQQTDIVYSSHEIEGEGEHKILEFIRDQRSKPGYNVYTRHCIYGHDADLILLGLSSHEPNMSILRGSGSIASHRGQDNLHFLKLNILREYLDFEFSRLKSELFFYDLECIIDDYVLLCSLVGNDFIPALPHLKMHTGIGEDDMSESALPILVEAYIRIRPGLSGYINEDGVLNVDRFEKLMKELGKIDRLYFAAKERDVILELFRIFHHQLNPESEINLNVTSNYGENYMEQIAREYIPQHAYQCIYTHVFASSIEDTIKRTDGKQFESDFEAYKRETYKRKFQCCEDDIKGLIMNQKEQFIRAVQWHLKYCYGKCTSTTWFYPHLFSPFPSDLDNLSSLDLMSYDVENLTEDAENLIKGIHPDYYTSITHITPGIPSFNQLPCKEAHLTKGQVKVFDKNSKKSSMTLFLSQPIMSLDDVAEKYFENDVFVNGPHYQEARVVAIKATDQKFSYEMSRTRTGECRYQTEGPPKKSEMDNEEQKDWQTSEKELKNSCVNRWGIDLGTTSFLVYANPIVGHRFKYHPSGRFILEKLWHPSSFPFPLQTSQVFENGLLQPRMFLEQAFPMASALFLRDNENYGNQCVVVAIDNLNQEMTIDVTETQEIDFTCPQVQSTSYMHVQEIAQRLNVSPDLVSKIMGHVYLIVSPIQGASPSPLKSRMDIGLHLNLEETEQEVYGYSKKIGENWYFTRDTLDILSRYMQTFPELFNLLPTVGKNNQMVDTEVFTHDLNQRLQQLKLFQSTLPYTSSERQNYGMDELDKPTILKYLKNGSPMGTKQTTVQKIVRPEWLYDPRFCNDVNPPDPSTTFELYDRVVYVGQGFPVPIGFRGTVVGIKRDEQSKTERCKVLFDQPFRRGIPVGDHTRSVFHLPPWTLMNVSHNKRQQ